LRRTLHSRFRAAIISSRVTEAISPRKPVFGLVEPRFNDVCVWFAKAFRQGTKKRFLLVAWQRQGLLSDAFCALVHGLNVH
jgi:hypothetical protein